jgi:hypothetical protein
MNIELYEGQGARLYITLNGEFSVYGGSDEDTFSVSHDGNVYKVDVHPHSRGLCSTHRYDIFAKNSDGKEWLVTSGKINVKNRQSTVGGDALSPVEYHLEVELIESGETETKQMIVGIPGKQGEQGLPGKSAYQYALDNGYVGTEQEFSNMMVCVKMYAEQAEQARQAAVDAQILSEVSAVNALKSAQDAQEAVDNIEVPDLTPEAIQQIVPMAWSDNSSGASVENDNYQLAIGGGAKTKGVAGTAVGYFALTNTNHGTAFGFSSTSTGLYSVAMGYDADATESYAVALGSLAKSKKQTSLTIGASFSDTSGKYQCNTEGTGSITIGAGANTLNTTAADGTVTESSNSVTIGCKAENKGADSIVIGAQASGTGAGGITIGSGQTNQGNGIVIGRNSTVSGAYTIAIGQYNTAKAFVATAIGHEAIASGGGSFACGYQAKAAKIHTVAIGKRAQANDSSVIVFSSMTEDNSTKTQLYFSGANTPLATQYYNGEAFMGYTVTDTNTKQVLACGTRRLSELFPDNSLTQPAKLDENGEWVMPKVFHPSDLDMPQEEPSEPEEYTPLPVYPIVEPEIPEMEEV